MQNETDTGEGFKIRLKSKLTPNSVLY